jgi:hypothetical protein
MGYKDDRHITGFGGPAEGGVRDGYRPESDGLAQAKYGAQREKQGRAAPEGRVARIRRLLRHLVSDV